MAQVQFNFSATKLVLVSEDTIYRREDHNRRLLVYPGKYAQVAPRNVLFTGSTGIGRSLNSETWIDPPRVQRSPEAALYPFRQIKVPQPPGQPFFLRYQSPPPSLFFDRFAGVVSSVQFAGQLGTTFTAPNQPWWVYYTWNKVPNWDAFFVDHSLDIIRYRPTFPQWITLQVGLFPYTFYYPDLTNDPWLELWHRPANPEAAIYPFRQIPQTIISTPYAIYSWASDNFRIEAEPIWRVPDTSTLNAFRWPSVFTPPPPIPPPLVGPTVSDWTTDATRVTADTINFTADGACLISGGGPAIIENPGGLAYSRSQTLRF